MPNIRADSSDSQDLNYMTNNCLSLFIMQKKKLLADLLDIVDRSRESVETHAKEVDNMKNFIKTCKVLVKNETPEFESKFENISQIFEEIMDLNAKLVAAEARTAEDLNDVAARFDVVFRVSEETMEKTQAVKTWSAKIKKLHEDLEADKAKGGAKTAKIEADIKQAIENKKKAIEEADAKLVEFIHVKEKYNTFKVHRLQHAYQHMGKSISEIEKAKSEAFERLRNACIISNEELEGLLAPLAEQPAPAAEGGEGQSNSPFE